MPFFACGLQRTLPTSFVGYSSGSRGLAHTTVTRLRKSVTGRETEDAKVSKTSLNEGDNHWTKLDVDDDENDEDCDDDEVSGRGGDKPLAKREWNSG
jgi:hypothetical protein